MSETGIVTGLLAAPLLGVVTEEDADSAVVVDMARNILGNPYEDDGPGRRRTGPGPAGRTASGRRRRGLPRGDRRGPGRRGPGRRLRERRPEVGAGRRLVVSSAAVAPGPAHGASRDRPVGSPGHRRRGPTGAGRHRGGDGPAGVEHGPAPDAGGLGRTVRRAAATGAARLGEAGPSGTGRPRGLAKGVGVASRSESATGPAGHRGERRRRRRDAAADGATGRPTAGGRRRRGRGTGPVVVTGSGGRAGASAGPTPPGIGRPRADVGVGRSPPGPARPGSGSHGPGLEPAEPRRRRSARRPRSRRRCAGCRR